jgi:oligopeptide transport system substrate-binding protein
MSMRGLPRATAWVAGAAALGLALAGCGGGSEGETSGPATGAVNIVGSEPENPLVPANTNETGGGNVLDAVFTKLVQYNPDTAAPENAIATSIESEDQTNWTIKIRDDWTFHDGTKVTAKSFVDAWNWAAYGPNAALNSYFFEPIEGSAEVAGEDKNGDEAITEDEAPVKEMSGLKVVSDTEFTVKLVRPTSVFPTIIGYTAFAPLPEAFYADPKAFGDKPIGTGPFQFVKWDKQQQMALTAWEDYPGDDKAKVKDVTFKIYQSADAAYADLLADNVDVEPTLPTAALAGEQYKTDLGDRVIDQAAGTIATITIPFGQDLDSADLRKAISLAIDRQAIVDNIFGGTREPATGLVSPVVDGYKEGVCENCAYDPAKAKEFFAKSGFTGKLTLSYNADGDHKAWTEAACNSIKNTLGVECTALPVPDFATFRQQINARTMKGMFRTGWQMDYPSIENFLTPLYATGASANDGDYTNAEVDALLKEAATLAGDEGIAKYQEAEKLITEDMPVVPMWYGRTVAGYSNNVTNVKITPFGTVYLQGLELKS